MTDIANLRKDYAAGALNEADAARDAIEQFRRWFAEALERIDRKLLEPNAMTLATVDAAGMPDARIVLLKEVDDRGFVFYTNYESRKAQDMRDDPRAALVFHWQPLERQVRIQGSVAKVGAAESDAYFKTRPLGSRIGAWASPQSEPIESREWLEKRWQAYEQRYGADPPRPPQWGGYRLTPERIEFWQGRASRLHDRLVYSRQADGWRISRLAP